MVTSALSQNTSHKTTESMVPTPHETPLLTSFLERYTLFCMGFTTRGTELVSGQLELIARSA